MGYDKRMDEKIPSEYYSLIISSTVDVSKTKRILVKAVFDWTDKDKALEVKRLLREANKPPLEKSSRIMQEVEFKIVHPDESL